MTEVRDARARLDPEAEAKRQEAKKSQRVNFSPFEDGEGITQLEALLDALDAHHLAGTIEELARVLKKGGAPGSLDELRAAALGHLAHPDRAARLLQPDLLDGAAVTGEGHIVDTGTGEVVTHHDKQARCRHGAAVIVHLSGRDLAEGGGAEVEGLGRITHAHLRELLAACSGFVRVRPVVDLAAPLRVSTYRPSAEMVWRVKLRDGREMFPYSQRSTRSSRVDLDHTHTWRDGGDTSTANLGPNGRRTHRGQTHGDFIVTQETAGVFSWTTPLGKTYWTSCHGTFTSPHPDVVSNEPCHTTESMLAAVLKAAASGTPDTGTTIRQRARASRRAGRRDDRRRPAAAKPPHSSEPASASRVDRDPWQPCLDGETPPF